MPEVLNCCDILLSHLIMKNSHNCSIKHLEYLSLGKPTVATDVGEVNFAIENEVMEFYAKKEILKTLLMQYLAKEPELRHNFGISGRSKV